MIRIDEIYYNIFLQKIKDKTASIHWFEPFGTTAFENICSMPDITEPATRILFWDQEPLHRDRVANVLPRFRECYGDDRGPDEVIIVHSERDSENIDWIENNYGVKSQYYFFHAWASLDWYRGYDRSLLSIPFQNRKIKHTFLCPNNIIGGQRKHRLELLSELVDRDLIEDNFVSFPERCPYENKTVAELCREYDIALGSIDLPLIIDQGSDYAGNSHKIDMWSFADLSLLQVVTETVYSGRRSHLTEKTFKSIVMQQPFVLVSCRGSLDYIRSYGFKTFGEFWNEDYDDYDDNTRIMRIGKLLNDINNLSVKEKVTLQKHLAPIVEHNFNWFYSQQFEHLLWQELSDVIDQW